MKTQNQNNLPTLQIIKIKKILFVASICLVLTILASCTAEEIPAAKPIKN